MASLSPTRPAESHLGIWDTIFGVDPCPLEGDLEAKKPKTVNELRRSVQSLYTYFFQKQAEQKERIERKSSIVADAKVQFRRRYGSPDNGSLALPGQKAYQLSIEELERQLFALQRHGKTYLEAIEKADELQVQGSVLELLGRKTRAGIATAEESDGYQTLDVSTFANYSALFQWAIESRDAMKQENLEGSRILAKVLDNLIDELDMEGQPAEDLQTAMANLSF